MRRRAAKRPGGASYSAFDGFKRVKSVCVSVRKTFPREPPKGISIDNATFGCQLASTYLALDFWGSRNRNKMLICQCQGVSVGSGLFVIFGVFRKKFPRGPGDGFCDFVCFRTYKISGYFRELNKIDVDVYKSPGCFAALRRYPCLRVQSSNACWSNAVAAAAAHTTHSPNFSIIYQRYSQIPEVRNII